MSSKDATSSARSRWRLLRAALLKQPFPEVDATSKRAHPGFRLFDKVVDSENDEFIHIKYILPLKDGEKEFPIVLQKPQKFDVKRYHENAQFSGFLNTGLMNVWEASIVLAWCLKDEKWQGKHVIELGAGMAAVTSLILAKYHTNTTFLATDGNPDCLVNIERNLKENPDLADRISTRQLIWGTPKADPTQKGDVVLVADCTYDTAFHSLLLETIKSFLQPHGKAYLCAPSRGNSLEKFIDLVNQDATFHPTLSTDYDETVSKAHRQNLSNHPHYSTDSHYPLLLKLQCL